ncbi:protein phosphatase 1 regulatory subunit 32 isoform X2 [Cynoglossus semilaevis]|uniref:protein phosphatase 1 regulatory subunit 32 isoform X2 n=1 Tax=Cynoglossus semilaevis TaxID=244447 RepID=UPI0007DCA906|nr:protein phosphatase 1 regulatory subunit 32 isoform X2 [Cynoglossus semilaevis]
MSADGAAGTPSGDTLGFIHRENTHGRGKVHFTPFLRGPSATGYTANQRPAVYYTPHLDHTDNPQLGLLLSDSFTSQTKRHYQSHVSSDRSNPLPNLFNNRRDGGFHQLKTHQRTVSSSDETEYQQFFVPHHLTSKASVKHVSIGPKVPTGFTEGADLHFITFQDKKSSLTCREPQRSSVMKSDFVRSPFVQATEATPGLRHRSCRETGFSRDTVAPMVRPTPVSAPPQMRTSAAGLKSISRKEPTGFLLNGPNNQVFPNAPFGVPHFTTHYKSTFTHGADWKSGRTDAGIIPKMDNAFNHRDTDRFIIKGRNVARIKA